MSHKDKILGLRERGRSYNEIAKTLGVSKGTVSYWLHGVPLAPRAKQRLQKNIELARKRGLFAFNRRRSLTVKRENASIRLKASKEVPSLARRDLLFTGIALYWGEGSQSENHNNPRLCFANSNPDMVMVFMRFLREILRVHDSRINPAVQIHPNINPQSTIKFWSRVTKLPAENFRIFRQVSRASRQKRPRRSLPYGTISIIINGRKLFFQMKGLIDGLGKQAL